MPELTPERLAQLRAVAEAATPGPWRISDDGPADRFVIASAEREHIAETTQGGSFTDEDLANAYHISTFNPTTVLALLNRVEELSLACAAALRVLVAAGLFEQDEDGNITADTRFYDDLCKLANAAQYVADYATDGLVAESEACLRHQFDAARAEADRLRRDLDEADRVNSALDTALVETRRELDRLRKQYEALRAGVERVIQDLRSAFRQAFATASPYHDGASEAYYKAEQMVRRVLSEAGGGENG